MAVVFTRTGDTLWSGTRTVRRKVKFEDGTIGFQEETHDATEKAIPHEDDQGNHLGWKVRAGNDEHGNVWYVDFGKGDMAEYYRLLLLVAEHMPKEGADLAVIGTGPMNVHKILAWFPWGRMDTFELRAEWKEWGEKRQPPIIKKWNFIAGDYKDTLKVQAPYDIIIYDVDNEADRDLVLSRLKPDGLAVFYGG